MYRALFRLAEETLLLWVKLLFYAIDIYTQVTIHNIIHTVDFKFTCSSPFASVLSGNLNQIDDVFILWELKPDLILFILVRHASQYYRISLMTPSSVILKYICVYKHVKAHIYTNIF
jgi:hypothetical protein